jgi:PBSX family phage portal protein
MAKTNIGSNRASANPGSLYPYGTSLRKSLGREIPIGKRQEFVTGHLQPLLEARTIQKGLFGFNDLSTFESDGTVIFDITSSNDEQLPIVNPIFPFKQLSQLYLASTTLRECVSAYVTNIESYGIKIEYIGPEGRRDSRPSRREYERLEAFLETLVINGETLQQARMRSRIDKEVIGSRAFEVIQDALGRVVNIARIPTNTLLLTRLEKEPVEVPVYNNRLGTFVQQKRRFRRFVQRDVFGRMIYYKEWGDPRKIDPATGKVDNSLSIEEEATSIWYDSYYTPGSPYGTPQWSGCIPALLGSREAEMVNLSFFRDNAIPALAVLVSGGALTEESYSKIVNYFNAVRGQGSMNRIVVLEATTEASEMASIDGSAPAPKVDIKPMLSDRQHEGLFSKYIKDASEKIRQSFRLPPIYIGSAEEYNRASAFASMQTAEQQVFVPERRMWDSFMENVVLRDWDLQYWSVRSSQPSYNDPQEISQLLGVLGAQGALTPNVCIELANRYLNLSVESITEEWGDMPWNATLVNLNRGARVKGFEYIVNGFSEGVAGASPPDAQNEIANSVHLMLDELLENVKRASASQ